MPIPHARRYLLRAVIALVVLVPAIQLVPYGHDHSNPLVVREPAWNSPQTRQLAARACFDCHSNETVWPWYANVAPVSWLVQSDVDEGREHLNFSDWQHGRKKKDIARKIRKLIAEGDMPPLPFRLMHPAARLTAAEKRELIQGLVATVGDSGKTARRD